MEVELNYLAILAAAFAGMVIGMLWYGPLFGKLWAQLNGRMVSDAEKQAFQKSGKMNAIYAAAFASQLVMAYVLAHFVVFLKVTDVSAALQLGVWSWLGLVATVMLGKVLWDMKPVKLWVLDSAHYLVVICAMTTILALWK